MCSENISSDTAAGGTDPRVLRAVAHPVRLDLLDLLRLEGPLTASRCAERLGLTPKVCSYHLNLLGKYGLAEETGDGKGRARPWRLVPTPFAYVHQPGEPESASLAADEFAKVNADRDFRTVAAFIAARHGLDDRWRNVSTMSSNSLMLTPQQLRSLGDELLAVQERYAARSAGPDPDARPVRVALYAVPAMSTAPTTQPPAREEGQDAARDR